MNNFNLLTSTINPYECTLEELKSEMNKMKAIKEEYYNVEQAIKIYINSCYGACASPFFECFNVNVAEATTLQGQDLIRFTQKILDDYFLNIWPTAFDIHKKMGLNIVVKPKCESVLVYGDTDSTFGDAIIYCNNNKQTIESLFNESQEKYGISEVTKNGAEIVKLNGETTLTFKNNKVIERPIKYIMRHKVTKAKWRLRSKSGKEVIVTNDHSLMVIRDNNLIEIKPFQVLKTDKLVCIK
ncbi:MAG: DNA polymerase domain-containing protein [Clostridia bacterium]